MKLKGKKITEPNVEVIIIPRGDGQDDIVFKAAAILDFEPFAKTLPRPEPPTIVTKDGPRKNYEDEGYKQALQEWSERRIAWMVITSLKATEDLEWEQALLKDPNTWHLYEKELRDSGFSEQEMTRIVNGVFAANCMSEERMAEARQRFLLSQALGKSESFSLVDALNNTQSGTPANASASDPQVSQTPGT